MARHSSRLLRLVRWQYIRWGLAFPAFTLALWACNSHDLQVPKPNPQQESDFEIVVSPERAVDILFMIDNSPSMDPKQQALATNFPKMIEALQKLEGGLPDVHVGVVSSDMGAGATEAGGNCSVLLGNHGKLWGNDPSVDGPKPPDFYNEFATVKQLKSEKGQKDGCGMNTGTRWIEDIQTPDGLSRVKNYQGELADVFSCLAKGVGVAGCGYEHQLQAVRVAINPAQNINPQNFNFLRSKAYLAVVLITDEDDCSADPNSETNDGMFFPRTLGDTASLRCATRGHVCKDKDGNYQPIPDYDPTEGYRGTGFSTNFADCDAKDVEPRPGDAEKKKESYKQLPLIRIREMIDSVNSTKERPSEQILVSGIIGWPQEKKDSNGNDISLNGVKYEINKDKTSMPDAQQNLWDYMPICKVESMKSKDENIYKAYGGFRLKKFLDSFKHEKERNVFSICATDNFTDAMTQIGNAIVRRLKPGCVTYPLIDTKPDDPTRPETVDVQPECQVKDRISCNTPGEPGTDCLMSGYKEQMLKECKDDAGNALDPNKAKNKDEQKKISNDKRPCWYLVYDDNAETGCPNAFNNQRITALRPDDGNAPPGTLLGMQCLTCASEPVMVEGKLVSACPAMGTM